MQNDHSDMAFVFTRFQRAMSSLILYRDIREDPTVQAVAAAVAAVLDPGSDRDIRSVRYYDAWESVLKTAEFSEEALVGNAWQNHMLTLILHDRNPFSLKAGFLTYEDLSPAIREAAGEDLLHLFEMYSLQPAALRQTLLGKRVAQRTEHPTAEPWEQCVPLVQAEAPFQTAVRFKMKTKLHQAKDWSQEAPALAAFYRKTGTGVIGRYKAFRWQSENKDQPLVGIARPDPITLAELIGYDLAREEVLQNTRNLMRGYQANNVLLYGDRGTGKSSTVKAILNAFAEDGLRLVEVPRASLQEFPRIIGLLKQVPQRFILFVDDLSFEDSEWNYKDLKAVLEGGLEVRPANVVIYATSNRRHLIREKFSDRSTPRHQAGADEVHGDDTTQEKLSLADRFGITVTFTTPDQEQYLEIVAGLARQRGLDIDPGVLRKRALQWERWQNVRSGRTARQFIDYLEAELHEPI